MSGYAHPESLGMSDRAPVEEWRYTPSMTTTATSDERTISPWRSMALVVALVGAVLLVWPAGVSAAGQPLQPQPGLRRGSPRSAGRRLRQAAEPGRGTSRRGRRGAGRPSLSAARLRPPCPGPPYRHQRPGFLRHVLGVRQPVSYTHLTLPTIY